MPGMDPAALRAHIVATCPGIEVMTDGSAWFFVHPSSPSRIPFITIVASDRYDPGSNLESRGFFRVNLGVRPATYRAHFGSPPPFPRDGGIAQTGHDFTRADTLLPHPVYAAMHWVCVVQPSKATFEAVLRPLIAEAFAHAGGPPR